MAKLGGITGETQVLYTKLREITGKTRVLPGGYLAPNIRVEPQDFVTRKQHFQKKT